MRSTTNTIIVEIEEARVNLPPFGADIYNRTFTIIQDML